MPEMSPFRRSRPSSVTPDRLQFQVVLGLAAAEPCTPDTLEAALAQGVDALVREARGIVLGPVGGIDFTSKTIELEFTMEAISPAVLYAKMGEVLQVLERAGFEYVNSKEELLSSRHDVELQPA